MIFFDVLLCQTELGVTFRLFGDSDLPKQKQHLPNAHRSRLICTRQDTLRGKASADCVNLQQTLEWTQIQQVEALKGFLVQNSSSACNLVRN